MRTIIQDSWSVLDHKIKYKKAIPGQLKRRINVLSALFELADREFRRSATPPRPSCCKAPDETAEAAADAEPLDPPLAAPPGSELNAFTFLKIATHFFKDFEFEPPRWTALWTTSRAWSPGMTRARFNACCARTLAPVKRYKLHFEEQNPNGKFNPYTVIRHCLYLGNKDVFGPRCATWPAGV
jgi:putative GTP pyrophosphokinase